MTKEDPTTTMTAQVQEVFEHWVATCRTLGKGPQPVLSDARRRKIERAIKDYGTKTCRDAISGITLSKFHMGYNASAKRYDDIELILRDSAHIERFATDWATHQAGGSEW
jgi:hypothetical protein